ncbi:hypothetical protein [Palaeococcus sp. (in: euryarchaeotes)]
MESPIRGSDLFLFQASGRGTILEKRAINRESKKHLNPKKSYKNVEGQLGQDRPRGVRRTRSNGFIDENSSNLPVNSEGLAFQGGEEVRIYTGTINCHQVMKFI